MRRGAGAPPDRTASREPLELSALDSQGREFPVEISLAVTPLRHGLTFSAFIRDITARKADQAQLLAHAVTDELTGLANRALLDDRLAQAYARLSRSGSSMAVLFIDVDRFKLVNDSLGHSTGDTVLREIAARLRPAIRSTDTVARFGGDEFVVLCEDTTEHDAVRVAEKILTSLRAPLSVDGHEIPVGASIGIAITSEAGSTTEELLRDADAAMYRAKERGRGRVEIFNEVMRQRAVNRLRLEADLRRAITSEQLRVFYQPVVDTASGQIVGAEALVRWEHPERGLLSPSEFVPVAEETGLIVPLGGWVLGTACRDAATWLVPDDFRLSVNLSARQVVDDDLVATVGSVLAATRFPASRLLLEITETALMDDNDSAATNMLALHSLGIGFAIDDFGTGYSSLLRLREFPIEVLKLDRVFVAGIGRNSNDMTILKAVAEMARALGIATLAEGVESAEQLEFVRGLPCRWAQGYLWAPPVPANSFVAMLRGSGPVPGPSAGTDPTSGGEEPWEGTPSPACRHRVVLVDDSPGDRSLIRAVLSSSGQFEVVAEAETADDAVNVVRRVPADLILLDVSLPGRDGLSILPSLKEAAPGSRIALLSGLVSEGLARAGRRAGALTCIDKGVSPSHLLDELVALFPTVVT